MRSRGRDDWHRIRSTHADVLSTLEQVVARHPSNPRPARGDVDADAADAGVDEDESAGAVVLPFRRRLVLVRGDGNDPDAA
jgi:hypothetical protein